MRRSVILLGMWLTLSFLLQSDDQIIKLISEKRWEELPSLFADETYRNLEKTFQNSDSVHIAPNGKDELLYKVKFRNYAEIGNITYNHTNNRYCQLAIVNQVKPLYFHNGYRKYGVENVSLQIGDAEILLVRGIIFEPTPAPTPLFFSGDWQFKIKPTDAEEQLTLNRLFRSDTFVRSSKRGIFIIGNREILKDLIFQGEIKAIDSSDLQQEIQIYKDYFGVQVAPYKEYWYLPPVEKDNLILFEGDRKSFYIYNFNPQSSPDTQLKTTGDNKIILSYDSNKLPKLNLRNVNEVSKMDMFLFFNPDKKLLSATSTLYFSGPSTFHLLNLHPDLLIKNSITAESKRMNIIRKDALCYILSPETARMTFFYSGNLESSGEDSDLLNPGVLDPADRRIDNFHYLSRTQNFYPNPGTEFFRSALKISLPEKMNCLASGTLIESQSIQFRNNFRFESRGTKGVSLICGNFKKFEKIDGRIPVYLYGARDLPYRRIIPPDEIRRCADFLTELYGPLDIPEIHLIYRRWKQEGGLSNTGFIIINLLDTNASIIDTTRRIIFRDNPVVLTNNRRDYLIHELAHQWWGGLVSWASYRDEWLTEGMAQLSAILYLEKILPAGRFQGIIDKIARSAIKYSAAGPVFYGKRIANIGEYDAFQGIIYNKSALILMMLRDILGGEEFAKRLRESLEKFRYQSIHSREFINWISQKSPRILRFFENWVYSRRLPEIACKVRVSENAAEVTVDQKETDFVFPLWIEVSTSSGVTSQMVIVEQRSQTFRLRGNEPIGRVRVNPRYSPVLIGKGE